MGKRGLSNSENLLMHLEALIREGETTGMLWMMLSSMLRPVKNNVSINIKIKATQKDLSRSSG